MPTLLDDGPAVIDGVVDAPPAAVELQALDIGEAVVEVGAARFPDVIPLMPPPSNVDIEPAFPEPDIPPSKVDIEPAIPEPDIPAPTVDVEPAIPEPDIPTEEHAALPVEPSVMGLRPPGLSSTEPIGIPAGPTAERGEAIPIAGEAGAPTCARLGPLRRSAAIVKAINRRALASSCFFRITVHRGIKSPATLRGIWMNVPSSSRSRRSAQQLGAVCDAAAQHSHSTGRGVILRWWAAHSSTPVTLPLTARFASQGR
jgi:hypothetical protein